MNSLWKNITTKTIQTSAKSGEKMKLVLCIFPFLLLNYIYCLHWQLWCSHFGIFDFCLSDVLQLPSLNWCYLVLHQKFIHFWTCSLWKALICLFRCTSENLNCKCLIEFTMIFNQIHLVKKAFPSLHLKVGKKI